MTDETLTIMVTRNWVTDKKRTGRLRRRHEGVGRAMETTQFQRWKMDE
jgi:hypothetical protein